MEPVGYHQQAAHLPLAGQRPNLRGILPGRGAFEEGQAVGGQPFRFGKKAGVCSKMLPFRIAAVARVPESARQALPVELHARLQTFHVVAA